ncbi:hypothetical protein [Nocardia seriolae]|uniref:DUF8020 domain-containing protein n=1 Tax=Nocardia seriolae TaxID=37332 RepID=A0ABC8AYV3_9NOCA|nr:hypothetical protein [Nocardia seriolae]APA99358.1 hypothetical protein NS506_05312 [Nocardia seriolae]OJF81042.1 hypothetical protein NS14008_19890 [Nocardia seriolae]PSK31219.1 hypothetical protein C6575_11295 [Nocardia seriolae]QOW34983.1 hypothetical protein IMZ23_08330 [Nocardia seriolae]QUN17551.1 hypothetical protein KEC46_36660 [Nocardia seriolae]
MRKTAAASALLAAGLCVSAGVTGTAGADAPAALNYTATSTGTDTVIRTDAGSMTVENGVFKIKSADGTVLAGTELSFRVDDFVFPIAADINDRTATLTPVFDEAHAVYQPVALPYEDQAPWKTQYDREQAAWGRMRDTISLGATVGTLVGGLGGAALGCLIGGTVGATLITLGSAGILTAMFLPLLGAAGAGCLIGAGAVGFVGTFAGQLLITAPIAVAAAIQYFTTINSPFQGK